MEKASRKSQMLKVDARTNHNNVITFRNNPDCSVVEILSPKDNDNDNDTVRIIETFCVHVEPRACSRAMKHLSSTLPLEDCLSHLKRVRRRSFPPRTSAKATSQSSSITAVKAPEEQNQNKSMSKVKKDFGSYPFASESKTSLTIDRPTKRKKPNFVLEILIGTHSRLHSKNKPSVEHHLIVREFGPLHPVIVPKYEPRSEQEWKESNIMWPTLYRPLRFDEYKKEQSALSESELNRMQELMDECISTKSVFIVDPTNHNPQNPALIECGKNGNVDDSNAINLDIVSISRNEQSLQDKLSQQQQEQHSDSSASMLGNNPLATPILLALQGVSRRERDAKMRIDRVAVLDAPSTEIDSNKRHQKNQQQSQPQQKRGQYICTGYDMYSFYEPNIFEAMACLHSRLRRLVYFVPDGQYRSCSSDNSSLNGESRMSNIGIDAVVWGCGISKHDIHHLSGTNHNFRAFEYRQSSYAP